MIRNNVKTYFCMQVISTDAFFTLTQSQIQKFDVDLVLQFGPKNNLGKKSPETIYRYFRISVSQTGP